MFAKFCNTSHPEPVYSLGPEVTVHFHSDESGNYPGFQITYSAVAGVPGCGGIFTAEHAEFQSPIFEGDYPPDLVCEYQINVPVQSRVRLTFLSFHLEDSPSCHADYLAVRNLNDLYHS